MLLLSSADFFSNSTFQKILLGTLAQSYSLDPDQDRQNVGPDLGPNCLQRLPVDDKSCSLQGIATEKRENDSSGKVSFPFYPNNTTSSLQYMIKCCYLLF